MKHAATEGYGMRHQPGFYEQLLTDTARTARVRGFVAGVAVGLFLLATVLFALKLL